MPKDDTIKEFLLRLPSKLKDKVTKKADAEHRSLNAQIIVALESHVMEARK